MNDAEIEKLRSAVENNKFVIWNPDSETAHLVKLVGKHAEEGEGWCAIFARGKYAALYNCELKDFVIAKPIE